MKNIAIQIFFTPRQIAAELGIDRRHLLRKIARGKGPKFKRYGNRYLIRKDWYEKWIEEDNQKCSV
jgi:excisionase family DNA binding protein